MSYFQCEPGLCRPHLDGERTEPTAENQTPVAHLIVSVHHLEASAGLVLLHITQGTLQTEDHVIRLLNHLHRWKPKRHCRNQVSFY